MRAFNNLIDSRRSNILEYTVDNIYIYISIKN